MDLYSYYYGSFNCWYNMGGVVQNLVVAPIKEDLTRQLERVNQLEAVLAQAKAQYDIPDSVLYDLNNSAKEYKRSNAFSTLHEIDQENLNTSVKSIINRNQTTQINFSGFVITISTANVNPDGETVLNIGYILPSDEMPESLQIKLYPAQTMTITSSAKTNNVHLFYISLIASDPAIKNALIEVSLMKGLKDMLSKNDGS